MEDHFGYSDERLEQLFSSSQLQPKHFTHEAHLRLAWIHITKYGRRKAVDELTKQIRTYATSLDAAHKYHHTITVAAINVVNHFICRSSSDDFVALVAEFPRIKSHFRELLLTHYSSDLIFSDSAKSQYVEPYLLPF